MTRQFIICLLLIVIPAIYAYKKSGYDREKKISIAAVVSFALLIIYISRSTIYTNAVPEYIGTSGLRGSDTTSTEVTLAEEIAALENSGVQIVYQSDGGYAYLTDSLPESDALGNALNLEQVQIDSYWASSTLTVNGESYPPEYLGDGDTSTSWQEAIDGNGEGEEITLYFTENSSDCIVFCIRNGNAESDEYYTKNGRVHELEVELDGFDTFSAELPDENRDVYLVIKDRYGMSKAFVNFYINSVYEGTYYDDTCISEITIYADQLSE